MSLKKLLKDIRKENGITQKQLADALGVSLDAIKKIETGQTRTPSSKLLDALSNYTNREKADLLEDILFEEQDVIYVDKTDPKFNHSLSYLSHMLVNGWNLVSALPAYRLPDNEIVVYPGEICKKKDPNYVILVDWISSYIKIDKNIKKEYNFHKIALAIMNTALMVGNTYKEIHILFNYSNVEDVFLFQEMMQEQKAILKTSVECVLYDSEKCEVVDEYRVL